MYASMTGITQAATGLIACSRSCRHGSEAQMPKPTQPAVNRHANTNLTVGRIPDAGCARLVNPPAGPVVVTTHLPLSCHQVYANRLTQSYNCRVRTRRGDNQSGSANDGYD
jgi:hypothetical protein